MDPKSEAVAQKRRAKLSSFLAPEPQAQPSTPADTSASISVDWHGPVSECRSTPTLQVVVNPMIERGVPIHDHVYRALRSLEAEYVRFVPWFPYPKLAVAELDPPTASTTSWDFSLIDPLVEDFMAATDGRSTIVNFSTIPEWMWAPVPWTIDNGALLAVGGDNGIADQGTDWTDYTFAVDVTPLATGSHNGSSYAQAGWLVRMRDSGDGYGFLLSNYPYENQGSGFIVFVIFTNGQATTVRPTALPFAVTGGQTYQVATTVSGSSLSVEVNGSKVLTVQDGTYAAGTVGFRESGPESATFGTVLVTDANGATLFADDFSHGLSQWSPPPTYPADPSAVDFGYEQGTQLLVPVDVVGDYYRRLVSWYTAGGFTDENGQFHKSNHYYELPYWEVLNEIDAEHDLSPQEYTAVYDAIVTAIQSVSPETKFVGLALTNAGELAYYEYFLDPANHRSGVPIDFISYHFYADPGSDSTVDQMGPVSFPQVDNFVATVGQVEEIRKSLAPSVRTTVDEVGTILWTAATEPNPAPIPAGYWNVSGAVYAYVFARLALLGIDVIGESQLVGFPSQYPSVSMLDWTTGEPNARYRVLELLIEEIRPGCQLIELPTQPSTDLYALAFLDDGRRKILLINKVNTAVIVDIEGLAGGRVRTVDQQSSGGAIRDEYSDGNSLILGGYGVAVAELSR
jgi:hypothetical protein